MSNVDVVQHSSNTNRRGGKPITQTDSRLIEQLEFIKMRKKLDDTNVIIPIPLRISPLSKGSDGEKRKNEREQRMDIDCISNYENNYRPDIIAV